VAFGFFSLIMVGIVADDGGLDLGGLGGGNVGIIEVYGILNEETGRPIIEQIEEYTERESIEAIVLHINSPGGGVAISQEIYDAVKRASDVKPVVAALASVAASGGYYVACGADRIIANPGSITGSIGVIFQFHTAEKLLEKIGVATETVKSGQLKDVGSYSRSMTEKEESMLRAVVMDTYEQFVDVVVKGREKDREDIYSLANGAIFTGRQAYGYGLVDTIGGLNEAIDLASELGGITGDPKAVRPHKRKSTSVFDLLDGAVEKVSSALGTEPEGPQVLYLYR
jgi:protease-4